MKLFFKSLILPFLFYSFLECAAQSNKYAIRKVVIDAGHGGHDSGCTGKYSTEKEVALAISLKLGKLIDENLSDVKVFYTRKTDVFVTLNDRAEIANNLKADLFICIHCNAGSKVADGTETFVMGLHKSESQLQTAQRENASILLEENYKSKYEGFDPSSPEGYIALTLYQNAYMDQSLAMATKVEKQLTSKGREDRGVKQAGFWVLYRTTMPSILIETGFLTNPKEEKFLNSESGQNEIAQSIFRAFKEYKMEMESKSGVKGNNNNRKEEESPKKTEEPPVDTIQNTPAVLQDSLIEVHFSVQIASGTKKNPVDLKKGEYKAVESISTEEMSDGSLKYIVGKTSSYNEALTLQNEMKEKGFKSAFIVGYRNGKRISVRQAQDLLKNNKVN